MNPTLPTYFLHILQGQQSDAQVLVFVLNFLREAEFFVSLVEDPTTFYPMSQKVTAISQ